MLKYFNQSIEMPGGWSFNQADTLKTIDLYLNSKFKTGSNDSKGFRKLFFNIVRPACDIATKFIDIDTANILLVPNGGKVGNELRVWFMQRRLHQYLKETGFAELLNEMAENYPRYGHIVLKKVNKKFSLVPLVNLRLDPTVRWITQSPEVQEIHLMTRGEMPETWNTEDLFKATKEQSFVILEEYKKVKKGYERCIYANLTKDGKSVESEINGQDELQQFIVLEDTVKELPYRELKWDEVQGRWLGLGFVEYLEDNQIATNEAENLERKGLIHKALQLYQTRDEMVGGSNVLAEAENGDIIKVNSEITPIQKDNSDLSAFNNTRARWDKNSEQKTFSFDAARGENLPSRTPLGVANLSVGMIASYFEFKREKLGLFIKRLIENDIIPDFQKDNAKEHTLTFLGSDDEIDNLDKLIVEVKLADVVLEEANKTGFFPAKIVVEDARQRIESQIKRNKNRYLKVPASYYKDAKYFVDVEITGEGVDTSKQNEMLNMAMQTIASNPSILQNKTTRTLFFALLSGNGLSPAKLNLLSQDVDQTPVAQGGSIGQANQGQAQVGQVNQTL